MGLTLGEVYLDNFELSAPVHFGGAQAIAVHKLPGGTRIIDAMGPDDHAINWNGILSGPNASSRARTLDTMRVAGMAVNLSWDVFAADVVISDLELEFFNTWWIPYRLKCTVLTGTQAPTSALPFTDLLSSIVNDLTNATTVGGVDAALALVQAPSALVQGTQANANAAISISQAASQIDYALGRAEMALGSADLASVVAGAGALASLATATGFFARAQRNFFSLGV